MKAIFVPTSVSQPMEIIDLDEKHFADSLKKYIDGYFERVIIGNSLTRKRFTAQLDEYVVMLVDESGVLKELPRNRRASILYGLHIHNVPIYGPAVLVLESPYEEDFMELPMPYLNTAFWDKYFSAADTYL